MDQTTENRFPRVILASASPRRLDLLRQVGIEPEIEPSHVEEVITSTVPDQVVMELSRQKAEDIAALHTGEDAGCDRRRYCGGLRWKNSWKAKG